MLQRLDVPATHADRVTDAQTDLGLRGIGAADAGARQRLVHSGLERRQLPPQVGKRGLRGHLSCHANDPSATGRPILTVPVFGVRRSMAEGRLAAA
jgi:hypothetical protein